MADVDDVVIALDGISRVFPPATVALRSATMRLRAGETVAIRGRSGSGKSTLLSIIGLLDQASAGKYSLAGADVSALSERERTALRRTLFSFVFQAFYLIPHLTARENVEEGLRLAGVPSRERAARARAAIRSVDLAHRADAMPLTLSGGEQQRVSVARALARRPRVLLCDEPTGNLDTASAELVLTALLDAGAEGTAVVIVTHDDEIAARCSRRLVVVDGVLTDAA